eukprot:149199-Pelagomonas_calceolata.AAC.4
MRKFMSTLYIKQHALRVYKGFLRVAYSQRFSLIGCLKHMPYQRQKIETKSDQKVCTLTTYVKQQLKRGESERKGKERKGLQGESLN